MGSLCVTSKSPIYPMGANQILSCNVVMGTLLCGVNRAIVNYKIHQLFRDSGITYAQSSSWGIF